MVVKRWNQSARNVCLIDTIILEIPRVRFEKNGDVSQSPAA